MRKEVFWRYLVCFFAVGAHLLTGQASDAAGGTLRGDVPAATFEAAATGLASDDRVERTRAFHTLYAMEAPETDAQLMVLLEGAGQSLRVEWRAVRLLGMRRVLGARGLLAAVLSEYEADPALRRAAAISLGELGGRESGIALLKALRNDPDNAVRLLALRAFYEVRGKRAAYDLERAQAHEEDAYVRAYYRWLDTLMAQGDTFAEPLRSGETSLGAMKGTKYLVYTPTRYDPKTRSDILVSVHGTLGMAELYLDIARERAEEEGVLLVAPWFDGATFPDFDNLNLANVGLGLPRTDLRLLEIVEGVGKEANARGDKFYLFGHSRGGQFVQRFVFAHPDRVLRAAACAPGMYLVADPNFARDYGSLFPFGPEPNPFAPDLAGRSFDGLAGAPITFFVGSEDERLTDAYYFLQEAQLRAARFGYPQQVALEVLPGVPHLGSETFPPAAAYLFGE